MNEKFEALKHLGAGEFEHLNGTLIAHLESTRGILIDWGASSTLCDAALYHAAYGTDGFNEKIVSLERRNDVAILIGKEAEALVYLYCSCDRAFVFPRLGLLERIEFRDRFSNREFFLSDEQAKSFCELTVANEMELILDSHSFKNQYRKRLFDLFESMRLFLSTDAINAYQIELTTNN